MENQSSQISVFLRFRPLSLPEKQSNELEIWKTSKNQVILDPDLHLLDHKKTPLSPKIYTFSNPYLDDCFLSSSNSEIFEITCKPFIPLALEGYNFTLFAFGQTGSGKTFTILGSESKELKHKRKRSSSPCRSLSKIQVVEKGLSLLFIENLLQKIQSKDVKILLSYFEIYNENIYDLFGSEESLSINEDPLKGFVIRNLAEKQVKVFEEASDLICWAEGNRRFSGTEQNQHSSRSHVILKILIVGTSEVLWNYESSVYFVDLAGSERLNTKTMNAESLNEGKHINTSLFYLCSVIHKLADKANCHVPYRNSNLTKILRNALGGNSFTSILCTASPALSCYDMTLSTMGFADIAKRVVNKVTQNFKENSPYEMIKFLQNEVSCLKNNLKKDHFEQVDSFSQTENGLFENRKEVKKTEDKEKWESKILQLEKLNRKNLAIFNIFEQQIANLEETVQDLTKKNNVLQCKSLPEMPFELVSDLEKFYARSVDVVKSYKVAHFKSQEEYQQISNKSLRKVLQPLLCNKENIN